MAERNKKKKDNLKKGKTIIHKSICSFLAVITAATLFCSDAEGAGDILIDRVEHTDKKFEEFEITEMDEKEFDAIVAVLPELCEQADSADAVMDVITQMEDYCCELMKNYTIAQIYTTLDTSNEEYDEQLKQFDELQTSVIDKVQQNYQLVALSAYSDDLKARVDDEEDWQDILDYKPLTQTQKDLIAKETDLTLKYDEYYNDEYTTVQNGTVYDKDTLSEAFDNGDVDFSQYCQGLADITTKRNEVLGQLFLELVSVRTELARTYGYDNYAEYVYEKSYDRDYMPEDLEEYREQIREYMAPLMDELYSLLFEEYGDDFTALNEQKITEEECLDLLGTYLPEISEDMMVPYHYMIDHNLCDLSVDDKKSPGGYSTTISVYNAPYMFNCAEGNYFDMETLIHEFGHYNQMYYGSEDAWYYGEGDLDLAEINSQGLELLFADYYDDIYGDYAKVMEVYSAYNRAYSIVSGCKEDDFQNAIYSNPDDLTIEKLNQLYYEFSEKYDDYDTYNSYYLGMYGMSEQESIMEWVEIPHTFQSPLYYISYSVSSAAVEELREVILDDRETGIETYLKLAQAGAENSFQETLGQYGLNNPIENPRFDVYADNIRMSVGLEPVFSDSVQTDLDTVDNADDSGNTDDADSQEVQTDEKADTEDELSDDTDNDMAEWNAGKKHSSPILVALLILVSIVLVITIIVIAVILSKKKKNDKKAVMGSAVTAPNVTGAASYNGGGYYNGTNYMQGNMQPPQNGPVMNRGNNYVAGGGVLPPHYGPVMVSGNNCVAGGNVLPPQNGPVMGSGNNYVAGGSVQPPQNGPVMGSGNNYVAGGGVLPPHYGPVMVSGNNCVAGGNVLPPQNGPVMGSGNNYVAGGSVQPSQNGPVMGSGNNYVAAGSVQPSQNGPMMGSGNNYVAGGNVLPPQNGPVMNRGNNYVAAGSVLPPQNGPVIDYRNSYAADEKSMLMQNKAATVLSSETNITENENIAAVSNENSNDFSLEETNKSSS